MISSKDHKLPNGFQNKVGGLPPIDIPPIDDIIKDRKLPNGFQNKAGTTLYRLLITFANSLDPDQDRQSFGPDLNPNSLTP